MERPSAETLEAALIEAVQTLNTIGAQHDKARGITDRANCMAALANAALRNVEKVTGGYVRVIE